MSGRIITLLSSILAAAGLRIHISPSEAETQVLQAENDRQCHFDLKGCSTMTNTISEIKNMVKKEDVKIPSNMSFLDFGGSSQNMSEIHFGLHPGYTTPHGKIKTSQLPWTYQCSIEAAVQTGTKVTLWYRGYDEGDVQDDISDGRLQVKLHTFEAGTQTGDWWNAHSKENKLDCPNAEVTLSDFLRQDLMQRFGGIYMDLDIIIIDPRVIRGPDGVPAQEVDLHVWADQRLVGNFMKFSRSSKFAQCLFDTWKLHWDSYQNHLAECNNSTCRTERDFTWGFMGPGLVTHTYYLCKDHEAVMYPPEAFGNHPYPCSEKLLKARSDSDSLLKNALALHTCNSITAELERLSAQLPQSSPMAHIMQDSCPMTYKRMTTVNWWSKIGPHIGLGKIIGQGSH